MGWGRIGVGQCGGRGRVGRGGFGNYVLPALEARNRQLVLKVLRDLSDGEVWMVGCGWWGVDGEVWMMECGWWGVDGEVWMMRCGWWGVNHEWWGVDGEE